MRVVFLCYCTLIIIIMYIYHALINALSAHMIHINLNMIFYTHVEHSPTKTIYIRHYKNKNTHYKHTHTHTHIYKLNHSNNNNEINATKKKKKKKKHLHFFPFYQ